MFKPNPASTLLAPTFFGLEHLKDFFFFLMLIHSAWQGYIVAGMQVDITILKTICYQEVTLHLVILLLGIQSKADRELRPQGSYRSLISNNKGKEINEQR